MYDDVEWRKLAGFFARQSIVDCHALMDMDAAGTALALSDGLTPEEMRALADLVTETEADAETETPLAELCALVAEELRTLADKLARKANRKRRRKGVKAQ